MSTLGLEPEHFLLTTGTFNLVVKDRRRGPPERSVFSPAKSGTSADARVDIEFGCPRNLLKLLALLLPCQPIANTGFPPVFHIWNSAGSTRNREFLERNRPHLPTRRAGLKRQVRREPFLARAGSEDSLMSKDLLEVLAKTLKPFEDRCPRIKPRGRGQFQVFQPVK